VRADELVMVGDSLPRDIEGAVRVGMRSVLVHRADGPRDVRAAVPVIRTLSEMPALIP